MCYSKDVLIFFFPARHLSPLIVKECDDSVVLNVTAVFSPSWSFRTGMTLSAGKHTRATLRISNVDFRPATIRYSHYQLIF